MAVALLCFCILSALIVVSGIVLTHSADELAENSRIGRSLAGVILLAGATSLPELSVGWSAVRIGAPDLGIGELLGSCLMNLMILAILDLVSRSGQRPLSHTSAAHALSATVSILMATVLLLGLLLKPRITFLGIGLASWPAIIVYLFGLRLIHIDQRVAAAQETTPRTPGRMRVRPLLKYLAGSAVIFFSAPLLARNAETLAELTGLAESFFGTFFVAAVTSLPEAVATYAGLRMGAIDLAIGNVFGSNCFNLFTLAILDLASPVPLPTIAHPVHLLTMTAFMLTTSVAILSLLFRTEKRFWRLEPDAVLLIILVLGSLYLVYMQTH